MYSTSNRESSRNSTIQRMILSLALVGLCWSPIDAFASGPIGRIKETIRAMPNARRTIDAIQSLPNAKPMGRLQRWRATIGLASVTGNYGGSMRNFFAEYEREKTFLTHVKDTKAANQKISRSDRRKLQTLLKQNWSKYSEGFGSTDERVSPSHWIKDIVELQELLDQPLSAEAINDLHVRTYDRSFNLMLRSLKDVAIKGDLENAYIAERIKQDLPVTIGFARDKGIHFPQATWKLAAEIYDYLPRGLALNAQRMEQLRPAMNARITTMLEATLLDGKTSETTAPPEPLTIEQLEMRAKIRDRDDVRKALGTQRLTEILKQVRTGKTKYLDRESVDNHIRYSFVGELREQNHTLAMILREGNPYRVDAAKEALQKLIGTLGYFERGEIPSPPSERTSSITSLNREIRQVTDKLDTYRQQLTAMEQHFATFEQR